MTDIDSIPAQLAAVGGEQAALGNNRANSAEFNARLMSDVSAADRLPKLASPVGWVRPLPFGARARIIKRRLSARRGAPDKYALASASQLLARVVDANPDEFCSYKRQADDTLKSVAYCGEMRYAEGGVTAAVLTAETHSLVQSHLQHCGNVWTCPVCASKIQAYRRDEVQAAIEWAHEHGKQVMMLTLTASHHVEDSLLTMSTGIRNAWMSMTSSRAKGGWYNVVRPHLAGYIRAAEVTHSALNGWHYHYHVLLFVDDAAAISYEAVRDMWLNALVKQGLLGDDAEQFTAAEEHAVKLDALHSWGDKRRVAEYVNKMACEATLSVLKRGRGKYAEHRTPYRILRDIFVADLDDPVAYNHDLHLWAEYALGLKRTRQITWSRGLKQVVGLVDASDEQIVESTDNEHAEAILWGLTDEHWALMRSHCLLDSYYEIARDCDADKVQAWLDTCLPGLRRIIPAAEAEELYYRQREEDARRALEHTGGKYEADITRKLTARARAAIADRREREYQYKLAHPIYYEQDLFGGEETLLC